MAIPGGEEEGAGPTGAHIQGHVPVGAQQPPWWAPAAAVEEVLQREAPSDGPTRQVFYGRVLGFKGLERRAVVWRAQRGGTARAVA